jgi:hypothetical protein
MSEVDANDIVGLDLVVAPNRERGEGIKLVEDEFYASILTKFEPFENQWGKQLRWVFEIQGDQYTWKSKEGKTGQFKVNGQSSFACSPKSKIYKWYSKLTGKEPAEGEKISLKSLVGMPCYVMIKIKHGKDREGEAKDFFNVDKVKARVVGATPTGTTVPIQASAPVQPTHVQAQAPVSVQTVTHATETVAPKVVEPVATAPKEKTNIFDDIF